MAVTLSPLPPYPSIRARESLTPSQSATILQTISTALIQVLSLSDPQLLDLSLDTFIASYVKDGAQKCLHSLIWDTEKAPMSQTERKIRHGVFLLAERLAPLGKLDLQTLVDFSVAFSQISAPRLRALFTATFVQAPTSAKLLADVETSAVPAFASLLSAPTQGLYGLRKSAHILLTFLRPAPASVVLSFARNKSFVRALATAYHAGLAGLAESYGGLRALAALGASPAPARTLDDWERLFLATKVALLDAFHVLVRALLDDVASAPAAGPALAARAEPAFDVVFGLLDLPAPPAPADLAPTPFLNRPLLADYQHAHDFARTLKAALRATMDARADLLEAQIGAMAVAGESGARSPGVLRLVLRSSGVPPGVDNLGRGPSAKADGKGKGKEKDMGGGQRVGSSSGSGAGVPDEQLDMAVAQVLDLFPDEDPGYLRYVLGHADYPYKGDAEKMIAALLDGTAPPKADVGPAMADGGTGTSAGAGKTNEDEFAFTRDRRNVFDDEIMDLSRLRIGKSGCVHAGRLHFACARAHTADGRDHTAAMRRRSFRTVLSLSR